MKEKFSERQTGFGCGRGRGPDGFGETQDIVLLAIESLAILCLINRKYSNNKIFDFVFGLSIGLAVMMKTFMILIPLTALLPFIFIYNKDLFKSTIFWVGLLSF